MLWSIVSNAAVWFRNTSMEQIRCNDQIINNTQVSVLRWDLNPNRFFFQMFLKNIIGIILMKYLNYFIDYQESLHRYSWSPEDEAHWLWWCADFSSKPTMRLIFLVQSEMFCQLWDELPLNLVHSWSPEDYI